MEKKTRKSFRFLGWKLKELIQLGTILGAGFWGWSKLETGINRRFDTIEKDVKEISDLLDLYLTWRFIYVNDPARKDMIPLYDPRNRTLEFIQKEQTNQNKR